MAYYSNMPKPLRGFYRRRRLKKFALGGGLAGGAYFGRRAIGRGIIRGTRMARSGLIGHAASIGRFGKRFGVSGKALAAGGEKIASGLGRIARVGRWLSKL